MTPRPITYHRPRERPRAPAVVVGVLGLAALVAAQLAAAGAFQDAASARPAGVAAGPTAPVTADADVVPVPGPADPSATPAPAPTASPRTSAAPGPAADRAGVPAPAEALDLVAVPTTTVAFEVGAVLDADAVAGLEPVLAVLTEPGAAPVLLTGSGVPGPDEASALRLAQRRAEAVAVALVDAGAPAALLSTAAVVDAAAGRTVVVASEVP